MTKIHDENRIVYVEPNDVNGYIDNNPLTPEYTDFCIYCNLIVEKSSRLKNGYAGQDGTRGFKVEYNSMNNEKGVYYQSFFQGESRDYNFLTTDYSNIHFNSIDKKTFVEGLQITGIDINYANRFCPTIVMNMVDIRGGGLFGREEAIHVNNGIANLELDEEGNIIDNFYNSFMTFPYPKYRLQIKGFYGKAVTYQLMCSNFTGTFDSSTGNFNITVTFIGYEYGLLSDIPLFYVMAAPYTKVGKRYWYENCKNGNWNLFNTKKGDNLGDFEEPIRLYDFYKTIESKITKNEKGESIPPKVQDVDFEEIERNYLNKTSTIKTIEKSFENFIQNLKTENPSCDFCEIVDNDNEIIGDKVIVIFNSSNKFVINNKIVDSFNTLGDVLKEYVDSYPMDGISMTMLPNKVSKDWDNAQRWLRCTVDLYEYLYRVDNKLLIKPVNLHDRADYEQISEGSLYIFNDAKLGLPCLKNSVIKEAQLYTLNDNQSYQLYTKIMGTPEIKNGDKRYISVIVLKEYNRLTRLLESIEKKKEEYDKLKNEGNLPNIKEVLGCTPYIGNYFKMVFCHIDTFIHTIKVCVDNIYKQISNGEREPSKLGVYNQYMTDVPINLFHGGVNKGVIPPFPGIYKSSDMEMLSTDSSKLTGWVGDVKGSVEWEEQKLIDDYYTAIRWIDADSDADIPWNELDKNQLQFNLLPCFIDDQQNKDLFYTRDGLAYYLGTMVALILCSMNNGRDLSVKESELIGAILALNIYNGIDNNVKKRLVENVNGSLANDLFEISTISNVNGNNDAKLFECTTGNTKDRRQRIFEIDNDKLNYVYMLSRTKGGIIPLDSIYKWGDLYRKYNFTNYNNQGDEKGYCAVTPKTVIDGQYAILENSDDFIELEDIGKSPSEYYNSSMFSIWLDSCNVAALNVLLEEYKQSGENLGNYTKEDFVNNIINKYWLTDENYNNYHTILPEDLSLKKPDLTVEYISENFRELFPNDFEKYLKEDIIDTYITIEDKKDKDDITEMFWDVKKDNPKEIILGAFGFKNYDWNKNIKH